MRIEGLRKFRGRNPRGYFEGLPWEARNRAYAWLDKFVARRKARFGDVPKWLFAIYVGQAKRLALNPPTAAWGRKMLAKRGGYAVQRQYQAEGRTGKAHPAHHAARVSAWGSNRSVTASAIYREYKRRPREAKNHESLAEVS